MFPLSFPQGLLRRHFRPEDVVMDPFAGRGTTLYAARTLGLPGHGIDSSSVAVAISQAKLANTTAGRIVASARRALTEHSAANDIPTEEFWQRAFDPGVLEVLCRLRQSLIANCESDTRKALRAIILGALHGPTGKTSQSYFSNQCPRTYAPKPGYAVRYWKENALTAPKVDVMDIIKRRAERYYTAGERIATGSVVNGDSQQETSFCCIDRRVTWIVTSPPYYGMRTYIPDQWLRHWFVGGDSNVDYSNAAQLVHKSQASFCEGMRAVWKNCAAVAARGCRLVVRFGAINDRKVDPLELIKDSLKETKWRLVTARLAGTAALGKRQAAQFSSGAAPLKEYDCWAELTAHVCR